MCWKLLYLCVFLQLVDVGECIPYSALLRLSCAVCKLNPKDCCFGTLIAPNLAITTAFCAKSCQYIVKNKGIIPINSHFHKINDIAGFDFHSKELNQSYVKISAVEPLSLIGVRVFVPITSNRKTFLKPTVILPCEDRVRKMKGFYICTSKCFGSRPHRGMQGVPLLLDNRLLGISLNTGKHLTQNAFIAVAPALSWIGILAGNVARKTLTGNVVGLKAALKELRYNQSLETQQNSLRTGSLEYTVSSTQSITHFLLDNVSSTKFKLDGNNNISSTQSITNKFFLASDSKRINGSNETEVLKIPVLDHVEKEKLLVLNPVNQGQDFETTFNFTSKPESKEKDSLRIEKNEIAVANTTKETDRSKKKSFTNVMQWFREVKASLSHGPPPILVLTTSPTTESNIKRVQPYEPLPTSAYDIKRLSTTVIAPSADFVDLT